MTTEAAKAAKARYDAKTARYVSLKLNTNTDRDLINHLEHQQNIQGYLKSLIRNDMKGETTMKTYTIKPEFLHLYGKDANPMTVLTESDVENFAQEWEMDEFDIRQQLIENDPKPAFRPVHRFIGKPGWQELNDLIREDSGCDEDYCETENDYKQGVREGFIKYDGYYTTVFVDD